MMEDNPGQSRLSVLPPKIERINDLRIAEPQSRSSSGWSCHVREASFGIHDNSAISKAVCSEIKIFKQAIQREIFIEKHFIEYCRPYE